MIRGAAFTTLPLSLEDQLRAAYELVDELHSMEVRLRSAVDTALSTYKGEGP